MYQSSSTPPSRGVLLIKIAVAYLLVGLVMGIVMAASHQFELRGVHTHINLLGWTTMAIAGLVYCQFPDIAASRLATWHFRLHNLGLPVMMFGLAAYSLGAPALEPMIGVGALLVTAGLTLFAIAVMSQKDPRPRDLAPRDTSHPGGGVGA